MRHAEPFSMLGSTETSWEARDAEATDGPRSGRDDGDDRSGRRDGHRRLRPGRPAAGEPSGCGGTAAYEEPVYAAAPPPAAPAPAPDLVEQLTQLADLKDRGVLTEEEFAAQKARLLGS